MSTNHEKGKQPRLPDRCFIAVLVNKTAQVLCNCARAQNQQESDTFKRTHSGFEDPEGIRQQDEQALANTINTSSACTGATRQICKFHQLLGFWKTMLSAHTERLYLNIRVWTKSDKAGSLRSLTQFQTERGPSFRGQFKFIQENACAKCKETLHMNAK